MSACKRLFVLGGAFLLVFSWVATGFAWFRIPGTNIVLFREDGIGGEEVGVILLIIALIFAVGAISKKLREDKERQERRNEINDLKGTVKSLEDKLEEKKAVQ